MTTERDGGSSSPGFVTLLASTGLTGAFVYAIFLGGTHPGISVSSLRLLSGIVAIMVIAGWTIVALIRPAWRPQPDLLLPIATVFVVFCVASLLSQRPRLSQDAILQGGGLTLAFLLLTRLAADPFFRLRMIRVVVAITVVIVSAYAIQTIISWGIWWSSLGRLSAPPLRPPPEVLSTISPWLPVLVGRLDLVAVNLTAAVCLLATPFSVAVLWRRSRPLGAAVAAMGLFVLYASASRGALLGLVFAGMAAVAMAFTVNSADSGRHIPSWRRASRRTLALTAIAGVVLVGAFVVLGPALIERFAGGIDQARLSLYGATLTLISEHPILGNGPGTWSILHSAVTPEGAMNVVQNHAHDTYLQTLSDVGIVGAIAVGAVALLMVRRLWMVFRTCDRSDRLMIAAILVGLAGATGHAISDHFLNLPTYCLILMALVAIGLETLPRAGRQPASPTRGARTGVVALLGLTILLPLPSIAAHAAAEARSSEARDAADRQNWTQAESLSAEAARTDPGFTLYRIELGLAMAHLGDPAARSVIEQAAAEDPLPHLQLSVAVLALADGDPSAALDAALLAKRRASGEAIIDLNLGEIALKAGRRDLAITAWAAAIRANVELASSTFFSAPIRGAVRTDVINVADSLFAAADDPVSRALLLAYSGSPAAAEADLRTAGTSTDHDVALARVLWFEDKRPEAIALLEAAAARDVMAPDPLHYLVMYCDRLADQACLDRYGPRELMVAGNLLDSAPNEGSIIPAPLEQRYRGVPPAYPASVYLQHGYYDMLAPDVLVFGTP